MAFLPLDGPAVQDVINISTSQVEAKVGASAFDDRKVVTLQPQGKIYVSFVSGEDGFLLFKNGIYTFEATHQQPLYIKALAGTVDVVVAERA